MGSQPARLETTHPTMHLHTGGITQNPRYTQRYKHLPPPPRTSTLLGYLTAVLMVPYT